MTSDIERYKNGKVYKIVCNITKEEYIGSCCIPLPKRKYYHIDDHKKWKKGNKRRYMSVFKIIDRGNFDIILIEDYPCQNKRQLLARERYWFDNIQNINQNKPICHEGEKQEVQKKYREEHKVELQEWKKVEIQCECGVIYTQSHKQRHFECQRHKKYESFEPKTEWEEHWKQVEIEKTIPNYICQCGSQVQKDQKTRHEKTIKHQTYIDQLTWTDDDWKIHNEKIEKKKLDIDYTCICGSIVRKVEKARHERSKKHQNALGVTPSLVI